MGELHVERLQDLVKSGGGIRDKAENEFINNVIIIATCKISTPYNNIERKLYRLTSLSSNQVWEVQIDYNSQFVYLPVCFYIR